MAHMLVEANDVCLTYHEPTAETRAIEHLSFQINLGEFVAIVGPSGCGKTSVLSLLAGLMEPSEGEIHIYDEKKPGYMLQRDHLLDWRTIEGNIMLGLEVKHMATPENRAYALFVGYLWPFRIPPSLSPAAFRRNAAKGRSDSDARHIPGIVAA